MTQNALHCFSCLPPIFTALQVLRLRTTTDFLLRNSSTISAGQQFVEKVTDSSIGLPHKLRCQLSTGIFYEEHQLFDRIPFPNVASTNHSMLNYLHINHPLKALGIFKKQVKLGTTEHIDEVTVSLALKACRGELKHGSQIHGFALSSGFLFHIPVSNSLMNMYCKCGQMDYTIWVFESLTDPDIVSWNTVLSGLRNSEDAFSFAHRMNTNGVVFDPVTYSTVLAFCSDNEEFLFGLQLHSMVIKFGFDGEVFVGNALISMYSRQGQVDYARELFDQMPNRDLVSWNAMISGYSQMRDCGLEANRLFREMVRGGTRLDHVSFTSAVSACGYERNLELGRQIHGLTIKMGYGRHVSVCNVLMSTYSKCEVIEDAKSVFYSMGERNVVSWTTLISLDADDAISNFNGMRQHKICPNDVTFIGLVNAITIKNFLKEGQMIHGLCIKINFMSTNVCNSFITMYAKFQQMQESEKVFEELDHKETISWNALISGYAQNSLCQAALRTFFSLATIEIKPNQFTFGSILNAIGLAEDISLRYGQRCHCYLIKCGLNTNVIVSSALLDMYAKRGSITESQRVFDEMCVKSQVSWTALISAYTRHGDFDSAMNVFKEMETDGAIPDSITFLSLLTACCRKGMVDVGRELLDSMINKYLIEPSPEHYSCMVDMLGRVGRLFEAEELMRKIPGGPGLSVLQSLLGSCRLYGNIDMAERVTESLIEMEPAESGSYVLMSNLYAEKGKWEKVAQVRKRMREGGVRKEIGFSWVDVDDCGSLSLHRFSSRDTYHPQCDEIWGMAEFMGLEMKLLRDRDRDRDRDREGKLGIDHLHHEFL